MPDARAAVILACAVFAGLGVRAAADAPRFVPVPVPHHVYDGGWEHFVGGGLAVFDCNGDDRPDLFAAGGSNPPELLVNHSEPGAIDLRAAPAPDISASVGAYPLDLDADGILDLAVLRVGPDLMLKGDGACGFSRMDLPGADFGDRWTTAFSATWEPSAARPTLAFGHYVDRSDPEGPFEACDSNTLLRPVGNGYAATDLAPGFCALSMLFTDWARGGRADLRVSNDRHYYVRGGEEQLWAMTSVPRLFGPQDGWASHQLWGMGIAARDLDGDGRDEVFLSSMGDQRLMRMIGEGPGYADVAYGMGTTAQRPYTGGDGRPSTGWHIAFGDVQNDGRDDAFIAKGNVQQMPGSAMEDPNNLLIQRADGSFAEAGLAAGVASLHRGRGAALSDLDGDGLLDLAVVNRRAPMEVWRNTTHGAGHWLAIDPRMTGPNRFAVGALVEITPSTGGPAQVREVTVGGGHAGGVAGPQHFGLGGADRVRMRLRWPGKPWSPAVEIAADQRVRVSFDGERLNITPF